MAIQVHTVALLGSQLLALVLLVLPAGCDGEKARLSTVNAAVACRETLLTAPNCARWPQLGDRTEAWGHYLQCVVDSNGLSNVVSLGRDGKPGGFGLDADIACFPDSGGCLCSRFAGR